MYKRGLCQRRTEDVEEKEVVGGVKNKSPVGRGAVQDGPKLFGTTPRAEGSSSARGNQVPLECDRPKRKTKQIFMPSLPLPLFAHRSLLSSFRLSRSLVLLVLVPHLP